MEFVTTQTATKLTGLSTEKLREWTSRRALISADIRPKGRGSAARYSWQTILLLRVAVALQDRFKLELQAHRELFASIGDRLREASFSSLWSKSLALRGGTAWTLLDTEDLKNENGDFVVLRLDPHLKVLSEGFFSVQPSLPEQLHLFSALRVIDNRQSGNIREKRKPNSAKFAETVRRLR